MSVFGSKESNITKQGIIQNFRVYSVQNFQKMALFFCKVLPRYICLKIILFLEKKAHICQILQGAASNYQMLNSSELFPAKPSPNTSK